MNGSYKINLMPDMGGPSLWRRRIVQSAPIPNTKTGQQHTLECGHVIMTFGSMGHLGGVEAMCTACREAAYPPPPAA